MATAAENPAFDDTVINGREDCSIAKEDEVQRHPNVITTVSEGIVQEGSSNDSDDSRTDAPDELATLRSVWKIFDVITSRRGILYALMSAVFFAGQGLLLEMIPTRLHATQIVVLALPVVLIGSSSGILISRAPLPKQLSHYLWLTFNGLSVSVALTTFTLAVGFMDVADAVAVVYSSLIFVCVLSWIILKEPLGIFDFVFSFVALAGVVFIARPHPLFGQSKQGGDDSTSGYLIGVGFALASALGMSLRTISYRKQTELEINKFVSIFSMAFVVTLSDIVVCTALSQWRVPYLIEWMYATGSGLSFFVAQLCLVASLELETSTMISIFLTFEIVFSYLLQFLVLDVSPVWTSYIGSLLLILASIGITFYKNRTTESETPERVKDAERQEALEDSIELGGNA